MSQTLGFYQFVYKGEPITDIHAWARERGERMVKYRCIREVFNLVTGKIVKEVTRGEMPETFWNTLGYGHYGERYEEERSAE